MKLLPLNERQKIVSETFLMKRENCNEERKSVLNAILVADAKQKEKNNGLERK